MAYARLNNLNYFLSDEGSGPPLLLLHGFTGSSATWAPLRPALNTEFRTLAPDLIGHGQTEAPADPARYSMARTVDDLLALLDQHDMAGAALWGYSLGARVALHLAVAAPSRWSALVLESGSPGLDIAEERAQRRAADNALAAQIERDGVAAFVQRWESQPLFASQQTLSTSQQQRLRSQRLAQRAIGLANSLRGMGTGAQESLWEALPGLSIPTLLLVGALDHKFCALGKQMASLLPWAQLEVIAGAGHAVHLEQPESTLSTVHDFLLPLTES